MLIDIYLGDEKYGIRRWDAAPRSGEFLAISGPKEGVYRIDEVIWGGQDEPQVVLVLNPAGR